MDEQAKDIARRAASRLAADFGPALPALVERELQTPGTGPQRYLGVETAIALAGLLVSVAQLVWQVHRDLSQDRVEASPEALARQVRLKVELLARTTAADRDRMIAVVVEELLPPAPKPKA
jgi:hypothetical protein